MVAEMVDLSIVQGHCLTSMRTMQQEHFRFVAEIDLEKRLRIVDKSFYQFINMNGGKCFLDAAYHGRRLEGIQ
jgi:hypothetical protein